MSSCMPWRHVECKRWVVRRWIVLCALPCASVTLLAQCLLPTTSSVVGQGCSKHQAGTLVMLTPLSPATSLMYPSPGGESDSSGTLRQHAQRAGAR